MNAEIQRDGSQFDTVKLIIAIMVLIAGIAGFYIFKDMSVVLRVIGLLVTLSMSVALVYYTHLGGSIVRFAQGSNIELKKVVWPTRKETMQTTLIVMVMVLFVGVLLWMFDGLLMWGVGLITG